MSSKLKYIMCVGVSASGKSYFGENLCKQDSSFVELNRDTVRRQLFGFKFWNEYKFSKEKEKRVTDLLAQKLFDASIEGKNAVDTNTNLTKKYRDAQIAYAESLNYEVEIKEFPISYEEAVKRDTHRMYSVGRDVIYKQWQQWNEYIGRKIYVPDESLPKAIIVDIDGTVASMDEKRGPFEWHKVHLDSPRKVIIEMVDKFSFNNDVAVVMLSGRDSVCRGLTIDWLNTHMKFYDKLYMRREGDMRKDAIIKEELFWEHVAPNYNVVGVVDDRSQMIRLWHDLKIPNVICVGNPYDEF